MIAFIIYHRLYATCIRYITPFIHFRNIYEPRSAIRYGIRRHLITGPLAPENPRDRELIEFQSRRAHVVRININQGPPLGEISEEPSHAIRPDCD